MFFSPNTEFGVSIENMMRHVKIIASWERLSGSFEEEKAFCYLQQQLIELGYHTDLIRHDAYISLPQYSTLHVGGSAVPSQTHSMGLSTPRGGVTAPLIDLRGQKEFTPEHCEGKLVVVAGRPAFGPADRAYQAGAVGILYAQELPIREGIASAAWGSPTPQSSSLLPRLPMVSISDTDANQLFSQGQEPIATMITSVDTRWRTIPLLTAQLDAPVSTKDFVMFSGHVDSWYYGAIDNGTVNATQLEIARLVAQRRTSLQRNFRLVFFSGHSHGRYAGSAWYCDNHYHDLHRHCVINVNADSLGGKEATDITRSIIMPEVKQLAAEIIHGQTGVVFTGARMSRVADQSFWYAGVTSAFASFSKQQRVTLPDGKQGFARGNADLGWWWHTPKDTVDCIDPENWLRDAKIFCSFIFEFLCNPALPLDFRAETREIGQLLRTWAGQAGGRFSLETTLELSDRLERCCEQWYARADQCSIEQFNRVAMQLGRILVPLNFTTGNRFENDPASSLDPLPALSPIRQLVGEPSGSDAAMQLTVLLTHRKNFVEDSLLRAIELIENDSLFA